jgi:ribosomal protein S18 acetylase RimI-like enzyme
LPKKMGFISDLFVNPDYQNKGVGSLLIKKTENFLQKIGCKVIEIEVMNQNIKARSLYSKIGYIDIKVEVRKYL